MDLTIINQNGKLLADSREVAEMIGKQHKNLLRDIQGYINVIEDGSKLSSQDFFIESTYKNSQNKTQPCYLLTKKGCDMVANKMTGEKGILFTAIYVSKFEEMEEKLKQPRLPQNPMQILELIFEVDKEQNKRLDEVVSKVEGLENNMPLYTVDCKELQALVRKVGIKALGGYKSPAYNDSSLRGRVYSDIQKQLKREFGVTRYEAIKRSQLPKAMEIVEGYKLPIILEEDIKDLNGQITMEV